MVRKEEEEEEVGVREDVVASTGHLKNKMQVGSSL